MRRSQMRRKRVGAALAVGAVAVGLSVPGAAGAKITTQCINPGGQEVHGQCNGKALDEQHVNPAGFAPPGHNK
jgi:hypothetical protein